jgi:hypothetical protein
MADCEHGDSGAAVCLARAVIAYRYRYGRPAFVVTWNSAGSICARQLELLIYRAAPIESSDIRLQFASSRVRSKDLVFVILSDP